MLCRGYAAAAFLRVGSSKLGAEEHDLRSIINPYEHRNQRPGGSIGGSGCAAAQIKAERVFANQK